MIMADAFAEAGEELGLRASIEDSKADPDQDPDSGVALRFPSVRVRQLARAGHQLRSRVRWWERCLMQDRARTPSLRSWRPSAHPSASVPPERR